MQLVHEGCGTGHVTVSGTNDDLRNALAMALDGVTEGALEPYTGASRAGVSLQTRGKCGLGHLRLATDGPGPGERQRWRGGELGAGSSYVTVILPGKKKTLAFGEIEVR